MCAQGDQARLKPIPWIFRFQPFPRQEFGAEHMQRTLRELGLAPSGSLVLKKSETVQPGECSALA